MEESHNVQLFIKLFALSGLNSNETMIYIDCNRIKGSFDEELL